MKTEISAFLEVNSHLSSGLCHFSSPFFHLWFPGSSLSLLFCRSCPETLLRLVQGT